MTLEQLTKRINKIYNWNGCCSKNKNEKLQKLLNEFEKYTNIMLGKTIEESVKIVNKYMRKQD